MSIFLIAWRFASISKPKQFQKYIFQLNSFNFLVHIKFLIHSFPDQFSKNIPFLHDTQTQSYPIIQHILNLFISLHSICTLRLFLLSKSGIALFNTWFHWFWRAILLVLHCFLNAAGLGLKFNFSSTPSKYHVVSRICLINWCPCYVKITTSKQKTNINLMVNKHLFNSLTFKNFVWSIDAPLLCKNFVLHSSFPMHYTLHSCCYQWKGCLLTWEDHIWFLGTPSPLVEQKSLLHSFFPIHYTLNWCYWRQWRNCLIACEGHLWYHVKSTKSLNDSSNHSNLTDMTFNQNSLRLRWI